MNSALLSIFDKKNDNGVEASKATTATLFIATLAAISLLCLTFFA